MAATLPKVRIVGRVNTCSRWKGTHALVVFAACLDGPLLAVCYTVPADKIGRQCQACRLTVLDCSPAGCGVLPDDAWHTCCCCCPELVRPHLLLVLLLRLLLPHCCT